MRHSSDTTDEPTNLRKRALAQLGVGPSKEQTRASTADALAALHRLASAPSTAGDALALLHEMQVHQVELDMQQEELRCSRSELEAALTRRTAQIERAPVGYVTIDAKTVVCEINLAGALLGGAARDVLLGKPLASLMSPSSADILRSLLVRARDGLEPETCELQLQPITGAMRRLYATVGKDTIPDRFLLVLLAFAAPRPGEVA